MKSTTRQKWSERVREWRASGQEASAYAADKGYSPSTLRWWASQLGREEMPRIVPMVARPAAQGARGDIVVEVGVVRVRVTPGFDEALLAKVICALSPSGER